MLRAHACLVAASLVMQLGCGNKPAPADLASSAPAATATASAGATGSAEAPAVAAEGPAASAEAPSPGIPSALASLDPSTLAALAERLPPGGTLMRSGDEGLEPNLAQLSKTMRSDGAKCIAAHKKKTGTLGSDGPRTSAKVEVALGPDGSKKSVKVTGVPNELATCLKTAIEKITFDPPRPGDEALKLDLNF